MDLGELKRRADEILPPAVAEYFNQGATFGVTTGEAAAAWDRLRLRPRALVDVSSVSTATTVLGHPVASPILVAPTTLQRMADPEGEVATARATAAVGSLMGVSSNAGRTFAEIGATGVPWWIQAYILRDRGLTVEILQRACDAGASAVVLTVDTPVVGRKHNVGPVVWDLVPDEFLLANIDVEGRPDDALDKADDLTADTIGWLRDQTGLPVVVKGVLRGDDARRLVNAGASAVQVSNHGGRQLDLAVSTADALADVLAALSGDIAMGAAEVYVDGGIRRAEHVLAALALGARAVFVGRPVLWALAAGGSAGVEDMLTGLTDELAHAMKLAGARTIADLTADLVVR